MSDNRPLLNALGMNAVFSSICALAMLLTGPWIAAQLGLASALGVYITAAVLLLFALQLWQIVRTRRIQKAEVLGIIGGDLVWVVASAVLLGMFYGSMTRAGIILVDLVALVVLFLAVAQIRGLKVLRQPGET